MGIPFSCPFTDLDDLDRRLEAYLMRSMSFESFDGSEIGTALRSVSFNGRDSEPAIMRSFGSGKMILEGSLSLNGRELETTFSFRAPSDTEENAFVRCSSSMSRENGEKLPTSSKMSKMPSLESDNRRFHAALRLQKVYKSFRTRRQLADCAVLVEQRWWKLLDFAELKRSSISFFDIEKPESAISRWSRARTRAAKVGKGLSKDERARKLALQHWLEAIDPRHRYGHNLQFYYVKWLHCESKQPFFYWLDIGEGKEVNLDRCSRSKLQQQCIKYLGPTERKAYEVAVEDGKFLYRQTGKLLDTRAGHEDDKWIFVLSTSKTLYVGQKQKGTFQHSSFLAGGATLSAGRLVVEDGILKAVWPHSGHYLPTQENFEQLILFLKEHKVDLSIVQKSATDNEEEGLDKKRSEGAIHAYSRTQACNNNARNQHLPLSRFSRRLPLKITTLEIPGKDDVIKMFKKDEQQEEQGRRGSIHPVQTPVDGYETAEEILSDDEDFIVSKHNLFDEGEESDYEEPIPREKIIQRINSHKGMKSYQLAQRLSCKWTTGAGPRIGCVRDYPTELQNRALEEVNLSPRSSFASPRRSFRPSPRVATPTSLCRETTSGRSPLAIEQVMLHQIATP
ncbi:IQ domain-containing protein IQM6 isoform X2 [Rhododendron vialii]|uniref:IQ domain-containing protein IQM6 isoform X2 n=1 Tax=Rhododendron vialii TaxID=182163 RepID=UPI002660354F|nr:IQ domain-containing protein IQM6 isoform X2 [Rhododendron vialii]